MGRWPKSKRCRAGVAVFYEASERLKHSSNPACHSEDHSPHYMDILEGHSGSTEVLIVLPLHLRGDSGMAAGDVARLHRLSKQVNVRAELRHDDAALRILSYDMKLLLDTVDGVRVALRKIPQDHERYGTYQLFLQPGHTSLYTIPNKGTVSRPKAASALQQEIATSDRAGCQVTDDNFVRRLLLALGAAKKPQLEITPEVRLKVMFGHLELHDAAQGQTYTRSGLDGLLKRLSTRGVASFSVGLRGRSLSPKFLLDRFKVNLTDPAVLCMLTLVASAKDTKVEMAIDKLPSTAPNEYFLSVAHRGIFETRGAKIFEFAIASPQREYDWCLTAEQVKVRENIPAYVEHVTSIIETARICGDIFAECRLDDVSISKLRHHVELISLKHTITFPLQNTPFILEAASVRSWSQDGKLSQKHELALTAPEWHETKYEPSFVAGPLLEERKLLELVGSVDSILRRLVA